MVSNKTRHICKKCNKNVLVKSSWYGMDRRLQGSCDCFENDVLVDFDQSIDGFVYRFWDIN